MKTYNAHEFVLEFAALTFTSGWADGEFFTAEPMDDTVESVEVTEVVESIDEPATDEGGDQDTPRPPA